MTRQTAIILIIVFFGIIFGGLTYSYFWLFRESDTAGVTNLDTIRDFFPFGGDANIPGGNDRGGLGTGSEDNIIIPSLRRISTESVAGYTIYSTTTSATSTQTKITKNVFRIIQKATGHIFDIVEDSLTLARVSNTTVPRVYEAEFLSTDRLVIRYLKEDNQTIETYLATIKKDETGNSFGLDGIYLPQNITDIAVSPLGNLFYLEESDTGSFGTTFNIKTNKSVRMFESPLKEWEFSWPAETKLVFFTRPSANVPGYLYSLNPANGTSQKVFGGVNGLSAIANPTASGFLYSENDGGQMFLRGFDAASNSYSEKSLSTLSEKCVWSNAGSYCAVPSSTPRGNLPDSWYQGQTFFSDNIWQLIPGDDTVVLVSNLNTAAGEDIDAINLKLSSDGRHLLFTNKRDGSLWSLKIEQ